MKPGRVPSLVGSIVLAALAVAPAAYGAGDAEPSPDTFTPAPTFEPARERRVTRDDVLRQADGRSVRPAPAPRAAAKAVAPAAKTEPKPVVAAPVAAEPVAAARESTGESLVGVGGKLLLGSLLLAGLLYAAARLVRRMPIAKLLPGAGGPIKVIGRTHLGAKGALCLVEVGRTTLLVGVTGTTIQTLHVWSEGAEVVAASAASGRPAPVPGQLRNLETRMIGRNG